MSKKKACPPVLGVGRRACPPVLGVGRRAIFFDRDGLLIYDPGWIKSPDEVKPLKGAIKAVREANEAGYLVVVVSNQSAVARGFISIAKMWEIDRRFQDIFLHERAIIDKAYYCPHHPDFDKQCECRKPRTGLFKRAQEELQVDMRRSAVVGDKFTDLEAGKSAGCGFGILVKRNQLKWEEDLGSAGDYDFKSSDVGTAVDRILKLGVS